MFEIHLDIHEQFRLFTHANCSEALYLNRHPICSESLKLTQITVFAFVFFPLSLTVSKKKFNLNVIVQIAKNGKFYGIC